MIVTLINKDIDDALLESNKQSINNYALFYQYANLQQDNIRYYYHDINNHLSTLRILKQENKLDEYNKYLSYIKTHYNANFNNNENVLLDIICQYYAKVNITINFNGNNDSIDYNLLLEILNNISTHNKLINIDLDKLIISCNSLPIDIQRYKPFIFCRLIDE